MRNLISGEVEPAVAKPARRPLSVIDGWRERPWLTASLFLAGMLIGLPAAWILGKPEYVAEAVIYVSPTFMKNLEEDTEQKRQYDTFVQQQVNTVTRFDILSESLTRTPQFRWTKSAETEKESIERLRKALDIRRIPDTYQIAIGLRSPNREGLAEFVNALATNFLNKARGEEFYGQKERLRTLESERAALDNDLAGKSSRLAELSGRLGVANFSPTLPNPYDTALTKAKEDLNGARNRRLEAEAATEGGDVPAIDRSGTLAAALGADPELARLRMSLNTRRMEVNTAVQGLAPDHPVRRRSEQEIKENEAELARVTERTRERLAAQLTATASDELRRARHVEAGLIAAINTQSALAGQFSRTLQEGVTLTNEIERMRARRNTIDDRIRYLTVEASAPGFLRMFAPAQNPEEPSKGSRKLLFAVFLAFTFALVSIVPVSLELANRKVRNSTDVERVLGFPAVGVLLNGSSATGDFRDEQVARLIAGLERSHQSMMATTFLFTSLEPAENSDQLIGTIGGELKRRGKRALIIDMAEPSVRPGLQDVLDDPGRISEAIVSGCEWEADRMPSGSPLLGTRFAQMHRLPEVLEKLHSRYDIILVAASPLFLSSDTEFLVRSCDVTLLTIGSRRVRISQLDRARQLLERLQPGGLGAIVTEMRLSDGGQPLRQDFHQFEQFRASLAGRLLEGGRSEPSAVPSISSRRAS